MKSILKFFGFSLISYLILVFSCSYTEYYAYYGFTTQGLQEAQPDALTGLLNVFSLFTLMAPVICFHIYFLNLAVYVFTLKFKGQNLFLEKYSWLILFFLNMVLLLLFPINSNFGSGTMGAIPMFVVFGINAIAVGFLLQGFIRLSVHRI